jgi:hypothetical protein
MSGPTGDRPLAALDDAGLVAALRSLEGGVDWPSPALPGGPDVAARVRARLVTEGPGRSSPARPWWRPARRALILAVAALLALAALAGAVGLGLPGLRLILGGPTGAPPTPVPTTSTSASPGPPGSGLNLGSLVTLAEAADAGAVEVRLPSDPAIGPPDAVYVDRTKARQVALVWAPDADLPATLDPGIGMILMAYDGTVDEGLYAKMIRAGTRLEPLTVGGNRGYWISGDPHLFFYERADGTFVDDDRRWVGDALVWSDGGTTYRLETALGREAAIAIAESMD